MTNMKNCCAHQDGRAEHSIEFFENRLSVGRWWVLEFDNVMNTKIVASIAPGFNSEKGALQ